MPVEQRCPTCHGEPSRLWRDLCIQMGQASGMQLIEAERERQVSSEGWTPEHDAEHVHGELAIVAAHLAVHHTDARVNDPHGTCWGCMNKRGNAIRDLAKAGALIAAEIDRLNAKASPKKK